MTTTTTEPRSLSARPRARAAAHPSHTDVEPKRGSPYIAGPVYDWLFFLASPLLALGIGIALSRMGFATRPFVFHGQLFNGASLLVGILIHAHLLAVVFRSHGRPEIFRRHKLRFTLVPIALYLALVSSTWVLVCASVLATFWDVWHSGLQTFGFARIYEAKAGNPPEVGRRLDWWINTLFYAGPILAGVTMIDHFGDFRRFEAVGSTRLVSIPGLMQRHQGILTWTVLAAGTAFLLYYVVAWLRLYRQGHAVSFHKVFLVATTGLCSIYTWGLNSFGMAFFIMNLFHAVQYLALVWCTEKRNIMRLFSLERVRHRAPLAVGFFLAATLSYGYFVEAIDASLAPLWAITLVVSLMHFWYDGFIWSVRKEQV